LAQINRQVEGHKLVYNTNKTRERARAFEGVLWDQFRGLFPSRRYSVQQGTGSLHIFSLADCRTAAKGATKARKVFDTMVMSSSLWALRQS
jgi:hypothetical protein